MKRPVLLGEAPIPGDNRRLRLLQGKDDCTIVISGGGELMSTRRHQSEDALGALPCELLKDPRAARVLIGGLGMGFTLAAALKATGPDAQVTVAELVPEVVEWNRGPLGDYVGRPLDDPRTIVYQGDVIDLLQDASQRFDVIALDVDNGPEGFSAQRNNLLYSKAGVTSARQSLRPAGVLAYWSASADRQFTTLLKQCKLTVREEQVYAHGNKGPRHTIWLATE